MKKKTWIILLATICPIALLLIAGIILIGSIVMSDLKLENKLESEFDEARRLVSSPNYSYEEVYEILDRSIVKKGDYKLLEESYKEYLSDIYTTLTSVKEVMDDNRITTILSYDNYFNDGPEFKRTKQFIKNSIDDLKLNKDRYEELFTSKKVKEYINKKGLSDYYIDIYNDEVGRTEHDSNIYTSIYEYIEMLESIDNVVNFFIENKNNWKLENNKIYFNSSELTNTYDKLLDEISGDKENNQDDKFYSKSFGTYMVPSGWIESKEHSTNSKFFYVLKGQENASRPNNISINEATNKYSSSEHDKFKIAILQQLSIQIGNREDVTINANGSTTANGYVVYTFVIHESDDDITTTQYYIVGDYKYILVHETVFGSDLNDTDNVCKKIVNSFKWK